MRAITDEQITERVTDLGKSWVMTSGAGCGKTYQMVQRYVAIIEAGVDVKRIIAVTFTEKAAAELKSRVRQRCREMIAEAPEEHRKRWETAARQLAMAPVTTIHGLCGRLLRENAVAAGVDPQFGQLDDTEQNLLLSEIARETLLERVHDGDGAARALVMRWGLATSQEILCDLVSEREDLAELLDQPPSAEELLARWQAESSAAIGATLDCALEDERWVEALEVLRGIDGPPPGDRAGDRILDLLEAADTISDPELSTESRVEALQEALAPITRAACGTKGNWSDRPEVLEEARAAFCSLAGMKEEYRDQFAALMCVEDEEVAELSGAIAAVASEVTEAFAREKQKRSRLDFADLQIMARDLLRDHPDVLRRVGQRYEHVLVDEFQDTNALQKQIIWMIAGGDPETGAPPADGTLFVVGDAKQSIYGFRSADVSVFNETMAQVKESGSTSGIIHLTRTRRSRPGLVNFFNDLFSHRAVMGCEVSESYEAPYEPVQAWREDHPMPMDAELILIAKDDLALDEDEKVSVNDARVREAEVLAARISEIVESGEYLVCDEDTGEPRPARYGDIGMLFRAMTSVGIYEYALRNAGVPFYTVAGQGFYNRQEIRDCLSLLQALENTSDEISLAGALRSPMFGICDETIFWLTRGSGRLMDALRDVVSGTHSQQARISGEQTPRIRRACEIIDGLRAIKDRVTLSELMERVLTETALDTIHLTQFAGRQALANLGKLTDLARSFESGGEYSLRGFISYLSGLVVEEHREGLAEVHEEAADVVKLLTIHKAKGLQWQIVVVPDISRKPRASGGTIVADPHLGVIPKVEDYEGNQRWGAVATIIQADKDGREAAESRRLLYVALTRARDMLIMSASMDFSRDGALSGGPWLKWLTEALGIDAAHVEDDTMLGGDAWSCRVARPLEAPETGRARRRVEDLRADLSLIDEALDAAEAGRAEPLPRKVRPVAADAHLPLRFSVSALQHYRRCPRLFYLRHVLAMPEAVGEGDWLHGLSAIERGNLVHHALEILGRRGLEPDAIEQAVRTATSDGSVVSRVEDQDREKLAEAIEWIVHEASLDDGGALYRDWVAGAARLRAEVQFVVPLAGARVEGFIDALVEDQSGEMRLLDYKTGTLSEERREGYRFQIGLYCAAVREITGVTPVAAALVMPDSRQIVRLQPGVEAEEALSVAREIIEAIADRKFNAVPDQCERCSLAYACELT